jgi:hypothetical protein
MWLQSNWWVNSARGATDYTFSLRAMTLAPYQRTAAVNGPDPARNLARTGRGVVPIEKSAHYGNWQYHSDGDTSPSEDSWDNSRTRQTASPSSAPPAEVPCSPLSPSWLSTTTASTRSRCLLADEVDVYTEVAAD